MKRKAVAVIAVIAAVGIISVYLLTRPKALGNMSGSCSERTFFKHALIQRIKKYFIRSNKVIVFGG